MLARAHTHTHTHTHQVDAEGVRAMWYAMNYVLRLQENALCTQATGLPT